MSLYPPASTAGIKWENNVFREILFRDADYFIDGQLRGDKSEAFRRPQMAAKPAVSTLEPLEAAQNGQAESSSGAGNASCIRPSGSQPGHNSAPMKSTVLLLFARDALRPRPQSPSSRYGDLFHLRHFPYG